MAVRMELSRILIRELNDMQIIELREVDGQGGTPTSNGGLGEGSPGTVDGDEGVKARSFPIVIGLPEASAIERRLKGIAVARPQAHDLLASVIEQLGGTLESITITDLKEHTFFATLDVRDAKGKMLHIDSRPSDAIALGIAGNVPIYVEEHVLESAMNEEA